MSTVRVGIKRVAGIEQVEDSEVSTTRRGIKRMNIGVMDSTADMSP